MLTYESKITNYLAALGLESKTIDVVLDVSQRIEMLIRSRTNGTEAYMTYDWFDDQFSNCPQKWSKVKELVRDTIWICDYEQSHGNLNFELNKAYCYQLEPSFRRLLLDYLSSDFFGKNERDGKKWTQKFKDLSKGVKKLCFPPVSLTSIGYPTIRPHISPLHPNSSDFLKHNLQILKKIEATDATREAIKKEIQRMESLPDGREKNSLISKLICDLSNLRRLRDGDLKVEFSRDGRWHKNGYVSLSSDLRNTLTVDGKPYQGALDVRACHWSLFGFELLSLDPSLQDEVNRWNDLFLNPSIKPTRYLQDELIRMGCFVALDDAKTENGDTIDGLKTILNGFLNGMGRDRDNSLNKQHPNYRVIRAVDGWFNLNFPNMRKAWLKTKIKETGVNLSKKWETPIMQHPEIFEKATELGVHLANEHDGVGFFAETGEHIQTILETIQNVARRHFGVKLVVVHKTITKTGSEWFMTDEEVIKQRKIKIQQLKDSKSILGKQVRNAAYRQNWGEMKQLQKGRDAVEIEILKKQIELAEIYGVN